MSAPAATPAATRQPCSSRPQSPTAEREFQSSRDVSVQSVCVSELRFHPPRGARRSGGAAVCATFTLLRAIGAEPEVARLLLVAGVRSASRGPLASEVATLHGLRMVDTHGPV